MRYFWALLAYVTSIVVAVASCSSGPGSSSTHTGGSPSSSGTHSTGSKTTGMGGGGSTGVGFIEPDSGPTDDGGPTCLGAVTCESAGATCGTIGDGCGGLLNCGTTCPAGQLCGGMLGKPNACAKPACSPITCDSIHATCGTQGDGCGGTLDCGTCTAPDTCGAGGVANACGHSDAGPCIPKTCTDLAATCGTQGDGCGGTLNCGTCPAGQLCGGGGTQSACGKPACLPKKCADLAATCGMQGDGCGGQLDCGTCTVAGEICGGGGVPSQCGDPSKVCTNLCKQQTTCAAAVDGGTPTTTSITGTVYAPNGTDPLPNVLVYVPNAAVQPFAPGVSCDTCDGTSNIVSGSPLVSTITAVDGTFTINNMPVGANIPLVIQNGRWRRQITIPNVAKCTNTAVAATLTRFPKNQSEGDIPLMAFVSGAVDGLECALRKVGIADTEFTNPTGTGRVRFYKGNGAAGAQISTTTPVEDQLWGTQTAINAYDMVYFACQGAEYQKALADQQRVINYANAGGRVFATHYSYVWLYNDAPFSTTAQWMVDTNHTYTVGNGTGIINTTTNPRGSLLANWLKVLYPTSTLGQAAIDTLRHDFLAVNAPSLLWISYTDPQKGSIPMHYTFDTPVGSPTAQQCGRVLFDDWHVEDYSNARTGGKTFPTECTTGAMTPQEKMLEFMLFDLSSFICPIVPPKCVPKTCSSLNIHCGPAGDGCGGLLDCGQCPSGQTCGGGGVDGTCGSPPCPAQDCTSQNLLCGPAGDGCGNVINCGNCPSGQTCGGGGQAGRCGTMACTPSACAADSPCGPVGDGCGNIQICVTCPAGETCGGGGTPGVCGKPSCSPKTCADLGFNCGKANDGCNTVIDCGTCGGQQTCGGGGVAGVCGGGPKG